MPTTQKNVSYLKFLPARLTEGNEWYISYYSLYPATGKLRRVKIKLNRIKGTGKRRVYARQIINELNEKLVNGWNPFIEQEAPKAFHLLFNVLDTYLKIQEREAEKHSIRCYKSYVKYLKEYLIRNKYSAEMYVSQFDKVIASNIMVELKQNPKYSFMTYNNYLQFFTGLFNWMMQFNYIATNPFSTLKKIPKKLIHKTRRCLTVDERERLKDFLIKENNNNYLVMCLLCYYCFLRPNEISLLRVRDLNLEKQVVYISKEIAKNDNDSIRTIPDTMMEYVKKLDLNHPGDYYLFGLDTRKKFTPGKKRAEGREIARYWSDVIRVKLSFPMEIQFYSLKDTGITNMLADGIAPNFVQGQADHSSLKMTSIYAAKRNTASQEQIKKNASKF
jgi:integrase